MSINHYKPHVWVKSEDKATRQLANGFYLHLDLDTNRFDVRPYSNGWLNTLSEDDVKELRKYPLRHLIALIDFDEEDFETRKKRLKNNIHDAHDIFERVYILGVRIEAEDLKREFGKSFEDIGKDLAEACASGRMGLWDHELLKHNAPELERLISSVKPFLFPKHT